MKRSFSPLLWLCLGTAVFLCALAALDPAGVYASYRGKLSGDTPRIAALFTAAKDGVFPWTQRDASENPSVPVFRPDTPAPAEPSDPEPAQPAPVEPEPAEPGPAEPFPADPAPEDPEFITVDLSYFDDAVFIGDSHIEGFYEYAGVPNATYYWRRGLMVWDALEKPFIPEGSRKLTIPQALEEHPFGKIYLMLGINEIGDDNTEAWAEQYALVVDRLRELQPDALIYLNAIFHTTQETSETTIYNNDVINDRNAAIAKLADGKQVFFIDANVVFDNEDGVLPDEFTGDGVHVMAPYYALWRDYLLQFGKEGH